MIVGSEKMVVYDDGTPEPVRVFDHGVVYKDPETFGEYQLSYRTGDILSPKLEAYEPLAKELEDFVRRGRDGGETVASARPGEGRRAADRGRRRLAAARRRRVAASASAASQRPPMSSSLADEPSAGR